MGNYEGWRYSQLDQINTKNVKDLKVAWQFSTGVLRGHEGSPLVIGKDMYLHSAFPNKVFKLSLENPVEPKILWKYEPKQDPSVIPVMCCDTVNRGPTSCRRHADHGPRRHDPRCSRRQDGQGKVEAGQRRSQEG